MIRKSFATKVSYLKVLHGTLLPLTENFSKLSICNFHEIRIATFAISNARYLKHSQSLTFSAVPEAADVFKRQMDLYKFLLLQVHQIHQIDLVDMTNLKAEYKGNTYKYILSLMEVFSCYHWLCPLGRKRSLDIKREVKKIYDVHSLPNVIQSDNGGEFKGKFEDYCRDSKTKMIKSRPYLSKSKGKWKGPIGYSERKYCTICCRRKTLG